MQQIISSEYRTIVRDGQQICVMQDNKVQMTFQSDDEVRRYLSANNLTLSTSGINKQGQLCRKVFMQHC
jgi:hypothetical protein